MRLSEQGGGEELRGVGRRERLIKIDFMKIF